MRRCKSHGVQRQEHYEIGTGVRAGRGGQGRRNVGVEEERDTSKLRLVSHGSRRSESKGQSRRRMECRGKR